MESFSRLPSEVRTRESLAWWLIVSGEAAKEKLKRKLLERWAPPIKIVEDNRNRNCISKFAKLLMPFLS
jgi:hypothetical protein